MFLIKLIMSYILLKLDILLPCRAIFSNNIIRNTSPIDSARSISTKTDGIVDAGAILML